MTLATHAVIGAATAKLLMLDPLMGFAVGFASHFVLDSIPHWDYKLVSHQKDPLNPLLRDMKMGWGFVLDLLKIGIDFSIGFILVFLFLQDSFLAFHYGVLAGAVGGVAPDFFQFVYFKFKHQPLTSLQRFHQFIHARSSLNSYMILGPFIQICIIIVALVLAS